MNRPAPGSVILYDAQRGGWLRFSRPQRTLVARRPEEVKTVLDQVEAATAAGRHAAGFVAYEAAPAFDPALEVCAHDDFPLAWFGIFEPPQPIALPPPPASFARPRWQPALAASTFARQIAAIKAHIRRGETYQANFTFPLFCDDAVAPWPFFLDLVHGQRAGHAAYLDTGRFIICSASPELFFSREKERLLCRPMKGTAPRGRTVAEDRGRGSALRHSAKNRAENVMILDMVRNDLGRLGPVEVGDLFAIEKYPTVWQMTSAATTRSAASLAEIFTALFPCASITGAPKVRTMQIIRALEQEPRRIYTGAIGRVGPQGLACFGVAIRTALFDRDLERGEYRVGAGITWGSQPAAEYRECLTKARILERGIPDFFLLETLLWTPAKGYALLAEHLRRLAGSAGYFDYPCNAAEVRAVLRQTAASLPAVPHKVRLLLAADGQLQCAAAPITIDAAPPTLRLGVAATPVDSADPLLFHKTTHRAPYERARRQCPEADEVLLWNERGEITEACHYNVVVQLGGIQITPPVACGLLGGTLRAQLLKEGTVREEIVRLEDLRRAEGIWLVNSVRGWRLGQLDTAPHSSNTQNPDQPSASPVAGF
ncbi:MAG: chorismate-binding protein [Desulfuromonadales bacterium]